MYKCVIIQVDSSQTDLFSSYWSPSPIDLYTLKFLHLFLCIEDINCYHVFWVSYLSPYLPYMLSPYHWPKSNHIAVFALDLKSAYKGEHMTFGLLSLANSLRIMFSSSVHLLVNDKISFFFMVLRTLKIDEIGLMLQVQRKLPAWDTITFMSLSICI
jgi:hypothetical protein